MSLIDLLLSQRAILISFGVVVLILLLAAFVYFGPSLRARMKRRAEARRERREAEAALREAALAAKRRKQQRAKARQEAAEADLLDDEDDETEADMNTPTAEAIAVRAGAPVAQAEQSGEAQGEATEEESSEEESGESEEGDSEKGDDELQSLLESVFVDEEQQERYTILMRGVEVPDVESLAAFSQQIAHKLRARVDNAN